MRSGLKSLFAVGIFLWAMPLCAQSASTPSRDTTDMEQDQGVWWSISVAAAGAKLTCDICDQTRDSGPALEAAVGAYATPTVRVGVDAGAWTFRDDDFREKVYTAGLIAEVHPRSFSGLYLIGGLGWSGYRARDIDVDPESEEEGFRYDAMRLRLGIGWDLPLTQSWVVGNRVTLDASSLGALHDEGVPIVESVGLSVVRFGIYIRRR